MPDNKTLVKNFADEVLNKYNIDATGKYFADDVVEQVPFPGQGPGVEGLKQVLRGFCTAFPDIRWTIDEQVAEGDKVVTRLHWVGTQKADFLGVPATGKTVNVWGVVIDRFENGKIKDTRFIMDALGLMIQLGVVPGAP